MSQNFKDKSVLVLGLGRFGGGVGVTRFLCEQGAKVRVSDKLKQADLVDSLKQLDNFEIDYRLGGHQADDLVGIDLVVVNSAIPPNHPFILEIEKRNIPQTTEVNIFFENCPGKIIAVIGTNGKETVVRLIDQILINAKIDHLMGGNIGTSLLGELDRINSKTYIIFEISSFQLHRLKSIKRRPEIAVFTNIQEDHLDWHGNLENYIQDKLVALTGQSPTDVAVMNVDDANLRNNLDRVEGRLVKTSLEELDQGVFVRDDKIIARDESGEKILSSIKLSVPGKHNLANAIEAAAVGYILGLSRENIEPALLSYSGIDHALEFVGEFEGVKFYNDSEATNPEATLAGLKAFDQRIWLIAGGFDKKIDYRPLAQAITDMAEGVAIIGQLTDSLTSNIHQIKSDFLVEKAHTLDNAYRWVVAQAKPGDIVLFSPGTSSYDQFKNLEERGDQFKYLVLKGKNGTR